MHQQIAIAGIHTGIGKTIAAAVLAEAFRAHYWKPVQAGLEESDSLRVATLTSDKVVVYNEAVRLTAPLSPHAAAHIDGVAVNYKSFVFPETQHGLLVETAGGLFSPINDTDTMADFITYFKLPVILIVRHYLGSINHTLLTVATLRQRRIPILGMIINGDPEPESEQFIHTYTGLQVWGRIPELHTINKASVALCAAELQHLNPFKS